MRSSVVDVFSASPGSAVPRLRQHAEDDEGQIVCGGQRRFMDRFIE